jgi:hypothetical protein
VALIGTLIANGQLIEGNNASPEVDPTPTSGQQTTLEGFIDLAFFGFAIPEMWLASGTAAFVVDSGYPCSAQNPLSQYMTAATQEATYTCYNNNLYKTISSTLTARIQAVPLRILLGIARDPFSPLHQG